MPTWSSFLLGDVYLTCMEEVSSVSAFAKSVLSGFMTCVFVFLINFSREKKWGRWEVIVAITYLIATIHLTIMVIMESFINKLKFGIAYKLRWYKRKNTYRAMLLQDNVLLCGGSYNSIVVRYSLLIVYLLS